MDKYDISRKYPLLNRLLCLFVYAFWNSILVVIGIVAFGILYLVNVDFIIANLVTLIVLKIMNYLVNKLIVFRSRCNNLKELILELLRFIYTKGFTMAVDFFGLILLVELLDVRPVTGKALVAILVFVINFTFTSYHVYMNKTRTFGGRNTDSLRNKDDGNIQEGL